MAKFYSISKEEMSNFLRAEKGWIQESQGNEFVFKYRLASHPFILIKVYSGIVLGGVSRGCGRDAIRVCSVNTNTNQGWIKAARVHRVEGWRTNLKARVEKVIKQSKGRLRGETLSKPPEDRRKEFRAMREACGEQEVLQIESMQK